MSVSAREAERGLEQRRRAEQSRALAAEHRALAHELRAGAGAGDGDHAASSAAFLRAGIEEVLAEVAELRAAGFEERALACDALVEADGTDTAARDELLRRASAAVRRASELEAQAIALRDELRASAELHDRLSEELRAAAQAADVRLRAAERQLDAV